MDKQDELMSKYQYLLAEKLQPELKFEKGMRYVQFKLDEAPAFVFEKNERVLVKYQNRFYSWKQFFASFLSKRY